MTRYRIFVPSTVTYITEVEADSPDEADDASAEAETESGTETGTESDTDGAK